MTESRPVREATVCPNKEKILGQNFRRLLAALVCLSALLTGAVAGSSAAGATTDGCTATPWPPSWYNTEARIPQGEGVMQCERQMGWVRAEAALQIVEAGQWSTFAAASVVQSNSSWAYARAFGPTCRGMGPQTFRTLARGGAWYQPTNRLIADPGDGSSWWATAGYRSDCLLPPPVPVRPI